MDGDKTKLERNLLVATSTFAGIAGLFTAINGLSETVQKFFGVFTAFGKWQLLAAALLLVISGWVFLLSRRRRSVLLHPEALRLERADPTHLVGRADDIEQLIRLCREQPLVFLEGESGCGKSALLQSGLTPALKSNPQLLPIYVESLVGSDWERDPRRFFAAALWSALDEPAQTALELTSMPGADAIRGIIETVQTKLGRTPLIILDQFDDYQNRHRERFLSRKTWLKPARLIDQNGFWRDVRDLVASNSIHLVVVTRTDTAAGLTSVRFTEAETYRLDRLQTHFVGTLLAELTREKAGRVVISDPEFGWTRLQSRLTQDLEQTGTVLPQQLKIVLAGLGTLPGRVVNVTSYERAGGTRGLETRFIEDRIAKAARLHAVTAERVRVALLRLVDPVTGQKTIEQPAGEILSTLGLAAPEKAEAILGSLAQDEVIRRRVNPGTTDVSWLLDHDYLAHAVREADRRANRWERTLADGTKALANAGESWARSWRAMLAPKTQLTFFWDRLRGRFRYGEHWGYAAKCLPRFAPYVAIFLAAVGLGVYEEHRRSEQAIANAADRFLNKLEFAGNEISEYEIKTLLDLASSDEALLRERVLTLIITDPSRARVFIRKPGNVIRAVAGVSPRFRDLARNSIVGATNSSGSSQFPTSMAIAYAALFFREPEAIPLPWWVASIKRTTNYAALGPLGEGLKAVAAKLSDSQAKEAVELFLAALKGTTEPDALRILGEGLKAVPAKLSDSQAKEAVELFLAALKGTTEPDALGPLGEGLKAVAAKLSDSQAKEAVELFLAALKGTTEPDALRILGEGLKAAPAKLSDSQANEAVEPFLAAIKGTTNPYARRILGEGLKAVPAKLSDSQAKEAVEPFLAALKGTKGTTDSDLGPLGEGLKAVAAKLSDSQAKEAVELFLAALKGTTDPFALGGLGEGLKAVPAKLSDSQAKEAVEPFLAALKGTTEPDALGPLGEGLKAVPAKLSDSQAKEAVEPFLAALKGTKGTTDSDALGPLGEGLKAVVAKLSDSQAKEAVEPFLAAIKDTTDPFALRILGEGLKAVPAKLSDSQAKEAVEPFLAALKGTTYYAALQALGEGLKAVPAKLSDSQAKEAVEPFLAAIKDHYGLRGIGEGLTIKDITDAIGALGEGLKAVAAKLSDSQAKEAVEPFLAAIKDTTDPFALRPLGEGLKAVAAKLDHASVEGTDLVLNGVLNHTTDVEVFSIYAELTVRLAREKPEDQQVEVIFHFLRNPLCAIDEKLLVLLEQVLGGDVKFDGDFWKAVNWVKTQQKKGSRLRGLDLDIPL